jgi:putative restriction endonuclease
MTNAVFIQNPDSIYDDQTGLRYHFPKQYLSRVKETVGDWVIFYQGKRGKLGYHSIQKVVSISRDPDLADHYYAELEESTFITFETVVPRNDKKNLAFETGLRGQDGRARTGGNAVSAVRLISPEDFQKIINYGFAEITSPNSLPRSETNLSGFAEEAVHFEYNVDRTKILTSRTLRDASFARQVKQAYGGICAISGLNLRNGGGRAEVEAAHIKPVKDGGPDIVSNGIALSGTIHWMFDRGLISVADDYSILVSHNKVDRDVVVRLFRPEMKLMVPKDPRFHPHPRFLKFHRETYFGQVA